MFLNLRVNFGTGYSSLSYLRSLPVHTVKIDRSFITDVPKSQTASQLVETIIVMCRTLKKLVVAEGVETRAQLAFLEQRGCDAFQGYLLAAPAPADEFATWLGAGYCERRPDPDNWRATSRICASPDRSCFCAAGPTTRTSGN